MQFELTKDFIDQIIISIERNENEFLVDKLHSLHPVDIAEIMRVVNLPQAQYIFRLLDEELSSDVLVEIEEDIREKFLESLSAEEIAETLEMMYADDATDVIQDLPEDVQEEVLDAVKDDEHSSEISMLLNYEEDSAGGIMDLDFISANWNWTVSKALSKFREQVEEVDQVYTIYVVDSEQRLKGTLSLKSFLYASDDTLIKDIFQSDPISVEVEDEAESVASKMEKYDLVVIPVVNEKGELLGRITIDDALDVIKEEAEKDYQIASGISEDVEANDNIWDITRARLPWLVIGLIGGLLGAKVIGFFEIEKNIELAFFIPLIAAMAGNVGIQSAAIVVQGLANNTLKTEAIFVRLIKELGVALLNGIICSILIFILTYILDFSIELSFAVSISLLSVIIFAAIFGTSTPLLLEKYKIDPALATGPFITTVNDITGLVIYFTIGQILL